MKLPRHVKNQPKDQNIIFAWEPELADDLAQSFEKGEKIALAGKSLTFKLNNKSLSVC